MSKIEDKNVCLGTPKKMSDFLPQKYLVTSQKDFKNTEKAIDIEDCNFDCFKELEEYQKKNKKQVDWNWKKQFEELKISETDQDKILLLYKEMLLEDDMEKHY
jgi:hypothetical protein